MELSCTHKKLLGALAVLVASLGTPAVALAQVPSTAERFGVHETRVYHPVPTVNPFRDLTLNASYTHVPTNRTFTLQGFYDGDGAGGMTGTVWKIRFMPDQAGAWTMSWSFTDNYGGVGYGSFTATDSGFFPGPPQLDPANNKFLVDARGRPIHWRGYGIKHVGQVVCCDPPLTLQKATNFVQYVIDGQLVPKGYNAAYLAVPHGWEKYNEPAGGLCKPFGPPRARSQPPAPAPPLPAYAVQEDCPLWGDYQFYSLRAAHVLDTMIQALQQRRIWTISWITFTLQHHPVKTEFATHYQPFIRYFVARYGAYYNYFMWSPTWEMQDIPGYVPATNDVMNYLGQQDPWHRLQGAHDQAQEAWLGWQRILPRQHRFQTRTIFDGYNRNEGRYAGPTIPNQPLPEPLPSDYPYVIIGAETLWEFCAGSFGKPRNATEVRRGLMGELFAGVLTLYDELFDGSPPCGGLGNGSGSPSVRWLLDWWHTNVNYRAAGFTRLPSKRAGNTQEILSGIIGQQYVIYRQNIGNENGLISVDLSDAPGVAFTVRVIDAETRAEAAPFTVYGGGVVQANSPFQHDTLVLLRR